MSGNRLPKDRCLPAGLMNQTHSTTLSRRRFLRRTTSSVFLPLLLPGTALGLNGAVAPSNRIVFGGIGFGPRLKNTLPNFLSFPDIQFRAFSECRADRLREAQRAVDAHYGNQDCMAFPDFRDMLAHPDLDAVVIATGNRWHGLASIYAARAGKDIYSEKPITLTIREGRALVDTCRRFGTIYQAGTQRRSTASYKFAAEMVRQGKIGRVHTVEMRVWEGDAIPHEKPTAVPEGWNYDLWLGQAPWFPYTLERGRHWHYFWDTAEGMMTDMGCHYTDQMQWALGRDHTGPVEFENQGDFPDPKKFCSDTPITATAKCRYSDGVQAVMYQRGGFKERFIKFVGDEGWIRVDDDTDSVTGEPKSMLTFRAGATAGWGDTSDHIRDLLHSIRSRTPTICCPEVAHRAMTICQAWSLSLRLGQKLKWDPVKEQFDLDGANRMLWREPRAPWRI
jgi:predicted dehydrogenase